MIPILFITYNRLEYTQKAFAALLKCDNVLICVYDNASTDGTREWLNNQNSSHKYRIWLSGKNTGIAGAMNEFIKLTKGYKIVGKVDNDTIVPQDFITRMLPHLEKADIVQAKHPILKATHPDGFDAWVSKMPADGPLRFNHFVGGSGILFRRSIINDSIPQTQWVLGGWREWQRQNPSVKKAFATDVEIQLLDTDENGSNYSQYPEYYRETKRL